MAFLSISAPQAGQLVLLSLKENSSSTTLLNKPVVLNSSLLTTVDKCLIANSSGHVTQSKQPEDVTIEDLTSQTRNIRVFGLSTTGAVICGLVFIPASSLDSRDAAIFPGGVIEVHNKTSTSSSISYP